MTEEADKLRVLAILPDLTASAIIYILRPFAELQKTGRYHFEYVIEKEVEPVQIRGADVILLSRNTEPDYGWVLDEIITQGKPYSFDLDDMFWDLPYDVPVALYLREPHRIALLDRMIQNADLVRVFTRRAFARVSPMNPNTLLAIPCIDLRLTPPPPPKPAGEPLRITYATGRQSEDILLDLFMDDLERVLDRYPSDQVRFTFWGEIHPRFANHPSVELAPILYNYESYMAELASGKYDIGLAPMIAHEFYLAKTNTKFRDYAAGRLAGIYSNVDLYECIRDGQNGLLVGDRPGGWYDAMVRLIEDADLRRRIQEQSYQDVYETYRQELAEAEWEEHLRFLVNRPKRPVTPEKWVAEQQEAAASVCLNLGGAGVSAPGVVSVGRSWGPGVTVIADLECGLPFAEGTFDSVVVNHILTGSSSLNDAIREVYRVCKDQAQVCVYEPYTSPTESPAAGLQAMNEDTPRRWTSALSVPTYEQVYMPQGSAGWGLGSLEGVDLRPVRMEFFYTPPYLLIRNEDRRYLRRHRAEVCEKILIHFLAIKSPVDDRILQQRIAPMTYVEPAETSIRRVEENNRALLYAADALRKELRACKTKLSQHSDAEVEAELRKLAEEAQAQVEEAKRQAAAIEVEAKARENDLRERIAAVEEHASEVKAEAAQREKDLLYRVSNVENHAAEMHSQVQRLLKDYQSLASVERDVRVQAERYARDARDLLGVSQFVARELSAERSRKAVRAIRTLFDRTDTARALNPVYRRLLDDSLILQSGMKGYLLQLSDDLQNVLFLPYILRLPKGRLNQVILAPYIDAPVTVGVLGIELVQAEHNRILQTVTVPAERLQNHTPVAFSFAPLPDLSGSDVELRIFTQEVNAPVRVYEWRKYPALGLGKPLRKPFCGMGFER